MFANLTPTVRTLLIANLAVFAAQAFFGSGLKTGLFLYLAHFRPSSLVAYPMAFGSPCSPPEYHMR